MSYGDLWLNILERRKRNYRVKLMGTHQILISSDENNFRISYGMVPYSYLRIINCKRVKEENGQIT